MKCALLLLLVGAFCVTVNARILTLNEAKRAMDIAWGEYWKFENRLKTIPKYYEFKFSVRRPKVPGKKTEYLTGNCAINKPYFNCGVDKRFRMYRRFIPQLRTYFRVIFYRYGPERGKFLKPQNKGGSRRYEVNALFHGRRLKFNFHVGVPDPRLTAVV